MSKIELKSKVKVPENNGVTAWSISRLNTYTQCPLKFKLTAIDKLKEPGSVAMDRGAAIHKEAEWYLNGLTAEIPESLKLMTEEFEVIKGLGAKAELEVTFTKDWGITGWFDADAWCRIKIDAMVLDKDTIRIIDFKTGKFRPNENDAYEAQLELYALAALTLYPDVDHVSAELWFLDSGDLIGTKHGSYSHKDVPELRTKWETKVTPMFVDTMFAPRLNQYCKWCHFRKENGGPCNA
jgi:hypothetical protein